MSKQVIEYGGEAVGVVVPDDGRFKFLAVKYHVWDLDAQRFRSADEARAAIRHLLARQGVPAERHGDAAAA
ncbi:hypothetical protein GFB56_05335 [Ensifer sp. T173]|uniref:Uncharacterized protein n=1 Tax=Ensifer canadensis TaxID=555315 RepID=A0AAW4FDP1_9HYPH|nr:hypothetical protein [Ensifer canadensis]MBM3090237.1 hypothetical protein [Ensifer canadensis]UBI75774.1 hypothetical protein J3R84_01010 [Ensifer canadensis]